MCLTTRFTREVLVVRLTNSHHHDNQHLLRVSSLVVDVHDTVAHLACHFILPAVLFFLTAASLSH